MRRVGDVKGFNLDLGLEEFLVRNISKERQIEVLGTWPSEGIQANVAETSWASRSRNKVAGLKPLRSRFGIGNRLSTHSTCVSSELAVSGRQVAVIDSQWLTSAKDICTV